MKLGLLTTGIGSAAIGNASKSRAIYLSGSVCVEKEISAVDAKRNFSEVLRAVRQGQSYVVTFHGRPVARITPVAMSMDMTGKARAILLNRLRSQRIMKIGRWKRDELYE